MYRYMVVNILMLNIVWNKNDDLTIFSCEEVEGLAEVRPAVSVSCFHLGFIALLKISYLYLYLSSCKPVPAEAVE